MPPESMHQRAQPLGGAVDARGQAGRSAADDHEVVAVARPGRSASPRPARSRRRWGPPGRCPSGMTRSGNLPRLRHRRGGRAPRRSRPGRSGGASRSARAPRAARTPGRTRSPRRRRRCAGRGAGPRPRRAGSSRSPGGTARRAVARAGARSGRCARGRSPRRSRRRCLGSPSWPHADEQDALRRAGRGGAPRPGARSPGAPASTSPASTRATSLAGGGQLLQRRARLVRRAQAADAVVGQVPVAQLPLDVAQQGGVVVDGDQKGAVHAARPGRRAAVAHTPEIVGAGRRRHQARRHDTDGAGSSRPSRVRSCAGPAGGRAACPGSGTCRW